MFSLNKSSQSSIEKITGIPYDQIPFMDIEKLDQHIEDKIGHKLEYKSTDDPRLIGRGSVYIFLNRLLNLSTIDKLLARI